MALNPKVSVDMVDCSQAMIDASRKKFGGDSNIRVFQFDLNKGLPQMILNEKFDAVVFCFALHHLEYDKRVPLYTFIHHILKSGSRFINGDMFKGDSPVMNE